MFCFKRSFQRDWWGSSEESLDLGARLAKCFLSKGAEGGGKRGEENANGGLYKGGRKRTSEEK